MRARPRLPPPTIIMQAVAALSDLKAAIAELIAADASYATDRNVYHRASQRAINALAGSHGEGYRCRSRPPRRCAGGDRPHRRAARPPRHAGLGGAAAWRRGQHARRRRHLKDALKARELMDYEIAASRALTYMEVAHGRPTETGVLGRAGGRAGQHRAGRARGRAGGGRLRRAPRRTRLSASHDGYIAWVTAAGQRRDTCAGGEPGRHRDRRCTAAWCCCTPPRRPLVARGCGGHAAVTAAPAATPAAPTATPAAPAAAPAVPARHAGHAAGSGGGGHRSRPRRCTPQPRRTRARRFSRPNAPVATARTCKASPRRRSLAPTS